VTRKHFSSGEKKLSSARAALTSSIRKKKDHVSRIAKGPSTRKKRSGFSGEGPDSEKRKKKSPVGRASHYWAHRRIRTLRKKGGGRGLLLPLHGKGFTKCSGTKRDLMLSKKHSSAAITVLRWSRFSSTEEWSGGGSYSGKRGLCFSLRGKGRKPIRRRREPTSVKRRFPHGTSSI